MKRALERDDRRWNRRRPESRDKAKTKNAMSGGGRSHPVLGGGAAAAFALLLAGCAYNGPTAAQPGPAPPIPAETGAEPLPPGTAASVAPAPRNGEYVGTGVNVTNPGAVCALRIRVYNFFVNGNRVKFGAYSGVIQPDGSLHMQAGPTYIYGQFIGSHFDGRFWRVQPACTYDLSLDPAR
ncbi:MAG TPA: hypothetical protein VG848_05385 [Acetobacteraceae bacterium]|nr:hypothetical protein [Acetobacteraceae bacterium]